MNKNIHTRTRAHPYTSSLPAFGDQEVEVAVAGAGRLEAEHGAREKGALRQVLDKIFRCKK
jgi:hypothetical protein